MRIFIVSGSSGDYEDHREWFIKAFKHKDKADKLAKNANRRSDEIAKQRRELEKSFDIVLKMSNEEWDTYCNSLNNFKNKYDPNYTIESDSARYSVIQLELEE